MSQVNAKNNEIDNFLSALELVPNSILLWEKNEYPEEVIWFSTPKMSTKVHDFLPVIVFYLANSIGEISKYDFEYISKRLVDKYPDTKFHYDKFHDFLQERIKGQLAKGEKQSDKEFNELLVINSGVYLCQEVMGIYKSDGQEYQFTYAFAYKVGQHIYELAKELVELLDSLEKIYIPIVYAKEQQGKANLSLTTEGPRGIGGWLILVILGLIISPISCLYYIFNDIMPFFSPENWIEFTSQGGQFYHPLYGYLVIGELIYNLVIAIIAIILLILTFTKSKWFPKVMIGYLIFALILGTISNSITYSVMSSIWELDFDSHMDFIKQFIQIIITSAIWIPYFIFSKRVKNTFVK